MAFKGQKRAKVHVHGGTLTVAIPARLRKEIAAYDGDEIEITTEGDRIVLTSKEEMAERHPEIDRAIAAGLADIAAGRVSPAFSSVTEWKAWLKTPEGKKFGKK